MAENLPISDTMDQSFKTYALDEPITDFGLSEIKIKYFERAYAYAMQSEYIPQNFFVVNIDRISDIARYLICDKAELPGRVIATVDQNHYGPVKKFPTLTAYNDITLSFICYGQNFMFPKRDFDQWMEDINPSETWNFKYKDSYSSTIYISQYDKLENLISQSIIREAFPIAISSQGLDYASQGHQTLQVTFAYTEFENQFFYVPEADKKYETHKTARNLFEMLIPDALEPVVQHALDFESHATNIMSGIRTIF